MSWHKMPAQRRWPRDLRLWVGLALGWGLWSACITLAPLHAEVVLAAFNWDTAGAVWQTDYNPGAGITADIPAAGGNPGKWLRITYPADIGFPLQDLEGVTYTTSSSLFAGDWTTDMYVRFDFYVDADPPDGNQIKLIWGDSDQERDWSYAITTDTVGWQRITVPLEYSANWMHDPMFPLLNRDDYVADLSSIDWIGILIAQPDDDAQQIFGLDNFKLMIPEPSQWWMLASAAMGIILSRRRRG